MYVDQFSSYIGTVYNSYIKAEDD